ncbi:MAG: ferrous iron transport protein B [Gammaproteobacteria bacterium]|nr:ferrous iron transport protein B [Gammaproteobacteria bacterium]
MNAAGPAVIVTLGNPNTGKSTLFNALTGLDQKVSNFPGVTVEHVLGRTWIGDAQVVLVDLPGTYSLSAHSPDELVAVDALLGRFNDVGTPRLVLLTVDATNLRRNLFLACQILELGVPVVIALTMSDMLAARGITIDTEALSTQLGCPVVPVATTRGDGLELLKATLAEQLQYSKPSAYLLNPALREASAALAAEVSTAHAGTIHPIEIERALLDAGGYAEQRLVTQLGQGLAPTLLALRSQLGQGRDLATIEARDRYGWINRVVSAVEQREAQPRGWRDTVDHMINHPLLGSLIFVLAMAAVFQSVFAWATPLMDTIDAGVNGLSAIVTATLPPGLLTSFIVDGVIAGVGSVVIFLPQILILFAFIIFLEDSGYMSRAAFLVDRLMRWCGLSGQSFIPMLSSFACAVPGIMGTRVIANRRDRLATIMAAPFMTCSARLPVYALLISAFVPAKTYAGGLINLHGLILLAFYLLGLFGAVGTAFLLKRVFFKGPTARFLMEMPPYRWPSSRSVLSKLYARIKIFLRRAGTVIFVVALVVWITASFPRTPGQDRTASLEASYLGQMSHGIAPAFAPLGWDWKVTAAVLASFPAREVVIAVLGTLYAVETSAADADRTLITRLRTATHPNGSLVFSLPMALGLMVFFAFCLQCSSTVAVMWRETQSWRWPLLAWIYMTALGYGGAFVCYRVGTALAS